VRQVRITALLDTAAAGLKQYFYRIVPLP